jgi:hypothetical protein
MTPTAPNPYQSPDGTNTNRRRWFYTKLIAIWITWTATSHLLAWAILTASGFHFQINEFLPSQSAGNIIVRQQTLHLSIFPLACLVGITAAWIWAREKSGAGSN